MAEYIEIDAPIDVAVYQRNRRIKVTLRQILESNDAKYERAEVRPVVRGKWIEHNYDPEYLSCDFSCSECNVYLEEYYFGEGQWPGKTDHYFCSNCGADMREES